MKIVTPPLIVKEADAFTHDVLDRRAYGEALRNLIQHSSDELVISLDGKWGEGKTTFVKMWQGLLSEAKTEAEIPSIYIDAFANDYIDDAFMCVVSAITEYADKNNPKKFVDDLKTKAKEIGGQLLTWSAKVALKAAALGVIKESDLAELKDIGSDIVEEHLTSHSKHTALIEEFKKLLSELPSDLKGDNTNPLVIIIDELDRCKPSFAVEMLEKIKHLFSVKNVVFILVMNKEQLEESVRCIYGQNIDAHTYLQKFINIETKLPKQITNDVRSDFRSYSRKLLELHEMQAWGDESDIIDCIEPFAIHFNLSLRQLEKVYTNLVLFYGSSRENERRLVWFIVFLSVIKTVRPDVFDRLLHQNITYSEICAETKLNHNGKDDLLNQLMNWVRYALITEQELRELDDKDKQAMTEIAELLQRDHSFRDKESLIPYFAQRLNMFVVK